MDKQQCLKVLRDCDEHFDTEQAHCEADDALCEFLRSIGHGDVADAFEKIDKWYA